MYFGFWIIITIEFSFIGSLNYWTNSIKTKLINQLNSSTQTDHNVLIDTEKCKVKIE